MDIETRKKHAQGEFTDIELPLQTANGDEYVGTFSGRLLYSLDSGPLHDTELYVKEDSKVLVYNADARDYSEFEVGAPDLDKFLQTYIDETDEDGIAALAELNIKPKVEI